MMPVPLLIWLLPRSSRGELPALSCQVPWMVNLGGIVQVMAPAQRL
jgi:hypothetical protein